MPNKKLELPNVGDIVYVDSALYMSHGEDDEKGGKATVNRVEGGMIGVEQLPGTLIGWSSIASIQEKLKQKFGDEWAHPSPDIRPESNTEDEPWSKG